MRTFYLFFFSILTNYTISQTNILVTNPTAEQIMLGNYDPADYAATAVINHKDEIIPILQDQISAEKMKEYLIELSVNNTRNTGSDTISTEHGIGAARRWAFDKFAEFGAENENRLIPFYLQFDEEICEMGQHRNICAILPGTDIEDPSIIVIEAHFDSRCHDICDVECLAHGMEDNGSGSALVLELARIMSQFSLDHTVVFMLTIGEEQGLHGAHAFAQFCVDKEIGVKAVFNNDIVGGIICGETSSEPSCPGLDHVDSTQVRLFSVSGASKQLSRFNKLQYQEEVLPFVSVPMMLTLMSGEDRVGRGGDHIPFRQRGFPAMRFTCANEHGNADVSDPDYHDRQHTDDDVLGVDTDGDMVLDSFFVDFNYLARNAVINGASASLVGIGPEVPEFEAGKFGDSLLITITDPNDYLHYRIFSRTNMIDFDTIYTLVGSKEIRIKRVFGAGLLQRISVAAVDEDGVESCFTLEEFLFPTITSTGEVTEEAKIEQEDQKPATLFQNRPNPFDEATMISYYVHENTNVRKAYILVTDLNGKELKRLSTDFKKGLNEVLYNHGYSAVGTFIYSLIVDGNLVDSRRMIFAN